MTDWYEIQIKGHLDQDWQEWFSGFTLSHQADGTTLLRGEISDQPALHGLLLRVNQLGLELLRVERLQEEERDNE